MSQNNENLLKEDSPNTSGSLLGDILASENTSPSQVDLLSESFIEEVVSSTDTTLETSVISPDAPPSESTKKIPKKSINTGTFLRLVWAMLLVTLIFFGAFLAYIVFNPGQASFFLSLGINPGDITIWLQQLVRAIFGIATFILAVVWIIYLFKAILTKKEYKKKKTISIILAGFIGVLFFSEITLWAFLEKQISATDYENPNGWVLVYDNEKLTSERFKNEARMMNFENLIGPLVLKFDLKADAGLAAKIMDIDSYEIDFDGAKCQWWISSRVTGVNPQNDQSIICTFDQAKVFKPTGRYDGVDRLTHKTLSLPINFQTIQIIGVVDIQSPKTGNDKIVNYNASKLKNFGKIHWLTEKDDNLSVISSDDTFSMSMKDVWQILCLSVFDGTNCDKLFIVPQISDSHVDGKIIHDQDKADPLAYSFHLTDRTIKNGEIVRYEWKINNMSVSMSESFIYRFPTYGDVKVLLTLTDSAGNTTELTDTFVTYPPLMLSKWPHTMSLLKVSDVSGKSLIDNSYNWALEAYYIKDIAISLPLSIQFDATDVKVENYWYHLAKVEWDSNGDGIFEGSGALMKYELIEEKRYTFRVRYTFEYKDKNITAFLEEKVIFEPEKKNISLSLNLTQDSEYAPATIHVDWSASSPKQGTITKFIYDFWDGHWVVEGDAVQDYKYVNPGEYTLTFTVVRDDGARDQSSRKIVIKDTPKRIMLHTSVSSGIVGKPIDFDTDGTIGQIEAYKWDFGDGIISEEATPTHTYESAWKFKIKITVTYSDRTVRSTDREIVIQE